MIAQMIAVNITRELNWGFAAALAITLLAVTLELFALFQRIFGLERLISGSGSK